MAKKKHSTTVGRLNIIDVSSKKNFTILPSSEPDVLEAIQRQEALSRMSEYFLKQYYSSNAKIERIQSRTFYDIVKAKIYQHKMNKAMQYAKR